MKSIVHLRLRYSSNVLVDVPNDSKVVAHCVDVEQGDVIIIEMGDGKTVLIDTGPSDSVHVLLDYIQVNLVAKFGFEYFDYYSV